MIQVSLNNNTDLLLDMKPFLSYPGYEKLKDKNFFNDIAFEDEQLMWDDMHDMHIHQILEYGKVTENV